jgi:hypothetical protein
VKRLRLATCVAVCATLLVAGCASGTATITGTLVGADGGCLYVRGPDANGADLYWLRHLPSDYVADADGLARPDGSLIRMGDSVTVSGALSSVPFDRQCDGAHTLDRRRSNRVSTSHRVTSLPAGCGPIGNCGRSIAMTSTTHWVAAHWLATRAFPASARCWPEVEGRRATS